MNAALTLLQSGSPPSFLQNVSGTLTAVGNYSGPLPGNAGQTQGSAPPETPTLALGITSSNFMVYQRQSKIELVASQSVDGLRLMMLDGNIGDLVTFNGNGLLPVVIDPGGIRIVSPEAADFELNARATGLQALLPPGTAKILPAVSPELHLSFGQQPGKADILIRLKDTAPTPAPDRPSGPSIEVLPYREFQLRASVDGFTTGTWKISTSVLTEQIPFSTAVSLSTSEKTGGSRR